MAEGTQGSIDKLQIEIAASSTEATKRIGKLVSALKHLQNQVNQKYNNPVAGIGRSSGSAATSKKAKSATSDEDDEAKAAQYLEIELLKAELQSLKTSNALTKIRSAIEAIKESTGGMAESVPEFSALVENSAKLEEYGKALNNEYTKLQGAVDENESGLAENVTKAKELASALKDAREEARIFTGTATASITSAKDATRGIPGSAQTQEPVVEPQVTGDVEPVRALKEDVDDAISRLKELKAELDSVAKSARIKLKGKEELKEALSTISELRKKLDDLSNGVKLGMSATDLDAANGKAGELKAELDKLKQKYKLDVNSGDVDKATKKVSALSKLLGDIARIAKYRAIRAAMKEVADAFATGINNLYQWSKALGSGVGSEFAASMDSAATSLLYLKNSVGAAVSPLIQAFIPVLQKVIHYVVIALNYINQLFSALSGKSTWTKAKEYATEYAEAVSGAAGAVQDFTLGIDELNVISESGGGGGSAATPDYSEMFEEVEIDTKISELARLIKEELLPVAKAVGAAIFAWKVTSALLGGVKKLINLFGNANTEAGSLSKTMSGISLSIAGFTLAAVSAYDIGKNGTSIRSTFLTILGNALGVIGATVAFGVTGLVISLVAAPVITIAAIKMGEQNASLERLANSEFGKKMQEFQEKIDEYATYRTTFEVEFDGIFTNLEESLSQNSEKIETAKALVSEIFSLDEIENKTSEEMALLLADIETLNGMNLDGINVQFDESTGRVTTLRSEIDQAIESLDAMARQEAYYDAYVETLKLEQEVRTKMNEAMDDTVEAYGVLKEAQEEYQNALVDHNRLDELQSYFQDNTEGIDDVRNALTEAKLQLSDFAVALQNTSDPAMRTELVKTMSALQNNIGEMQSQVDAYDSLKKEYDDLLSRQNEIEERFLDAQNALSQANEKAVTLRREYVALNDDWREANTRIAELKGELENLNVDTYAAGADAASGLANGLLSESGEAVSAASDIASDIISETRSVLDSHSPSKEFESIGEDTVSGLAIGIKENADIATDALAELVGEKNGKTGMYGVINERLTAENLKSIGKAITDNIAAGISENISTVETAMNSMLNSLTAKMETFTNNCRTAMNDLMSDYSVAMASFKVSPDGAVTYSTIQPVTIGRFASGGYVDQGQMFVAQEAGPELVGTIGSKTAVANNQQITTALYQAVLKAMQEANANQSQQTVQVESKVYLDGKQLTTSVEKVQRQRGANIMAGGVRG